MEGLRFQHAADCTIFASLCQTDANDDLQPGRLDEAMTRPPSPEESQLASALGWTLPPDTLVIIDGSWGRKRFQPPGWGQTTFDPAMPVGSSSKDQEVSA